MNPIEMIKKLSIAESADLSSLGFTQVGAWLFAKDGKTYDLSAADLSQIERIEREGLFLVEPEAIPLPDRIEYRTIAVEPISDLIAICELIPEFNLSDPAGNADSFAALEIAKAALANRHVWTGESIPVPTEATPDA